MMQSIIKASADNQENMKKFFALLHLNVKKETANNYIGSFIIQTKRIAEKSSQQAPFWQILRIVATKINNTCDQVNTLYEDDRKFYGRKERYANHTRKLFQQYIVRSEKFATCI